MSRRVTIHPATMIQNKIHPALTNPLPGFTPSNTSRATNTMMPAMASKEDEG